MALSRKTKRKAQKAQKKAQKTAVSTLERISDKAQQTAEDGRDMFASTVVPAVSEGAKDVAKKASDLVDQYLPQLQDAAKDQGERIAHLTDSISPKAEKLRHDLQDDYLPRAKRTAGATNAVVASAVAAAVDAARKEFDKGQVDIKNAYTKPTPKQQKGRAGRLVMVLALAAAGAGVGYLVWKRTRPVEDPWAPPSDFARAHYPASASTDTDSAEVSDSVGGAEAGDVARSLQGGKVTPGSANAPHTSRTEDRTGDTAPHEVKFDSADGKGAGAPAGAAGGTHRAADDIPEQGRVIDPATNPEDNPADPDRLAREKAEGDKRGNHRGDA